MAIAVERLWDITNEDQEIVELHRPKDADNLLDALVYDLEVTGLTTQQIALLTLTSRAAAERLPDFLAGQTHHFLAECFKAQPYLTQIRADRDLNDFYSRNFGLARDNQFRSELQGRMSRYLPDRVYHEWQHNDGNWEEVVMVDRRARNFAANIDNNRQVARATSVTLEEMGLTREAAALDRVSQVYTEKKIFPLSYIHGQKLVVVTGL